MPDLCIQPAAPVDSTSPQDAGPSCYALLGNPNTGKTTLFNALCGLRAKTANFPGSTVEARVGTHRTISEQAIHMVDLPGIYSLHLDRPESCTCREFLAGQTRFGHRAEALLIVADATNLQRNLMFVNQALQQSLPAVVALNMIDLAQRRGLTVDVHKLSAALGVPVLPICARSGQGISELSAALHHPQRTNLPLPDPRDTAAAAAWADDVVERSVGGEQAVGGSSDHDTLTDRLDAAFTHPVLGVAVFAAVMVGLFYTIFTLAAVPMSLIELLFKHVGQWIGAVVPAGPIHDLLADGVVGGIAGTLVFLPQICLLFFLISLLEDTGYLARAAFVMDRLLRRFGLPGQAFVPMLSAHACAIPAILSTRLIPDHRDRLATIFVTPFLSCSARLPVYVLLISVLFADRPVWAGLAFTGCYVLGALAALCTAMLMRRTVLRGPSRPMVLELPSYKLPSLRNALMTTLDRANVFLRKAGTVIVAICVALWWLGAYPVSDPPPQAIALQTQADQLQQTQPEHASELRSEADSITRQYAKANSFIGRIGRTIEPVFRPLGYDWQISVGVLSSFMAREVFVSTMSVVLTGTDADDAAEDSAVRDRIVEARRADGSLVFTRPAAASLLVFYVLAMQCLPTLAVSRRETGKLRWPLLQLGYMSVLAYAAAFATFTFMNWMGWH